jgi:thiol-disulfide isomerase/thioredoxin
MRRRAEVKRMATPTEEIGQPTGSREPQQNSQHVPQRARLLHVVGSLAAGLVVITLAMLLLSRIGLATSQVHHAQIQRAADQAHTVPQGAMGTSLVGRTAPDVIFNAWTGQPGQQVSLSSLRGHPVVLNIWEATCYPCTLEAPLFVQANKTYQAQGVIFVGVALYTSQADGEAFLKQYGLTYLAGAATTNQTVVDYSIIGVPDTYFINSAGQIVDQKVGQVSQQELTKGIQAAMK